MVFQVDGLTSSDGNETAARPTAVKSSSSEVKAGRE
jgi:hypothetical protein